MLYISGDFYNHLDMTFWHKITIGHSVETVNIYQNVQGMIVYKQQSLRSYQSYQNVQGMIVYKQQSLRSYQSYQNVQGMIVYKQQSLRSFNSLALLQKKSFSLCSPETSWTAILLLASLTNW